MNGVTIGLLTLWSRAATAADVSLVGLYDSAALQLQEGRAGTFAWVAAPGMTTSCGPAKAPDGLGVFEAEAMAGGMTPALALVLRSSAGGVLTTENVRVSLGQTRPEVRLHPAVRPRTLAVSLSSTGAPRHKQLLRTQLEMELCLEHKVGRGWIGGATDELRQAFLLDPPPDGGPDRKYFGGQREPVPALLGPPDACLRFTEGLTGDSTGNRGDNSLDLVPSDIWGASLRWCRPEETSGAPHALTELPLRLGLPDGEHPPSLRRWEALEVTLSDADDDRDVLLTLTYQGQSLLEQAPLFSAVQTDDGNEPVLGITDLLARLPHRYPALGPPADPERYTLLLIPNWQLVEGLRRVTPTSSSRPVNAIEDGVGFILAHPDLLYVQVPDPNQENWLNLTASLEGGPLGLGRWGYVVGMLSGREPIILPGTEPPTWTQSVEAHRADWHGLFLGTLAVLIGLFGAGLKRLRDLWVPVPEERAAYWPGSPLEDAENVSLKSPTASEKKP